MFFDLGEVHDLRGVRMHGYSATQMRHIALRLTAGAAARARGRLTAARAATDQIRVDGAHGAATAAAASDAGASAAVGRLCRAFARVVVLLDQMVARAERHQMSVVGGRRYGHGSRASHVRVTQLIGQRLQLVRREVIVVPQYVIMRWATRALDAGVRAQVEVELGGMSDARVHGGARRDVARAAALFFAVRAEETCVVTLLHGHKCDARLVARLQFHAGLAYRHELVG